MSERKIYTCDHCKKDDIPGGDQSKISIVVGRQTDPLLEKLRMFVQKRICVMNAQRIFGLRSTLLKKKRKWVLKKYKFTVGGCFQVSPTSPKGY